MTHDTSDAGNSTPAQKAMKQTSKISESVENKDDDPVGEPPEAKTVSKGDKPVGQSDNDGSSPYEQPNHLAKRQRQGE